MLSGEAERRRPRTEEAERWRRLGWEMAWRMTRSRGCVEEVERREVRERKDWSRRGWEISMTSFEFWSRFRAMASVVSSDDVVEDGAGSGWDLTLLGKQVSLMVFLGRTESRSLGPEEEERML